MDIEDIMGLPGKLSRYLSQFESCFYSIRGFASFETYVQGQLSDLERKSVEPIADAAGMKPRTLQMFLSHGEWDEAKVRDTIHGIVKRKHPYGETIGIIDETSFPKKGAETAGVQRQYCGARGKVENCLVSVHLAFACGEFHTLIDASLYVPQSWSDDEVRRERVKLPDDVRYRPLHHIALEQVDRAIKNKVRLDWLSFDERYGGVPEFLEALEQRGMLYVGEMPRSATGWTRSPRILTSQADAPQEAARLRKFPRLAASAAKPKSLEELLAAGNAFRSQEWVAYHVKDTHKGPEVWEVKETRFYQHRSGLPSPALRLIVARSVLDGKMKFFVTNAPADTAITDILRVAFTRWRVERCFQDSKGEIGLDHFEVRTYPSVVRHLVISMVSHLFLAEQAERLRPKHPAVTVCQIKAAMDALVDAAGLPPRVRAERIEECAANIKTRQARNTAARASAEKARCETIQALGYRLEELPKCSNRDPTIAL